MEQDLQEESVRMQELLEQNVQLELDRDRRYVVSVKQRQLGITRLSSLSLETPHEDAMEGHAGLVATTFRVGVCMEIAEPSKHLFRASIHH